MNNFFSRTNSKKKDKFLYYLAFVFLFPLWSKRHHKQQVIESVKSLSTCRWRILTIIKYRQKCIGELYDKHRLLIKPNWREIFRKISDEKINYSNMYNVELEIESVHGLIATSHDIGHKLLRDFNRVLSLSEGEINIHYYAYYALIQKVQFYNRHWPWRNFLRIVDFDGWQINY